ncbi:MAG: phosphomannomutase/phosphoglucomutase [Actinobacteria bacterium]|nr:phosphomannomutase/phosphoglucomutase [Actinomycetota bacterium]NDD17462.1 phosphomannomutase/phosphoglucomutase [Acidimicrobiia bacterium]NBS36303.1 phosphomannomutase/phosphoglucomutase [Actinomycetota bacterium]NCV08906.1 phosphomannomutase/phosphoglucomutase [Actinomycetota bacterium]NCV46721.1 phosphomannomutase/phosphoglucomutase [Actinomycetota bacterium]
MPNLDAVVKAYDVRGTVPDQLDESLARAFGVAFARFTDAESVAVAHDMRPSGPALVAAFEEGLTSEGVSVVNLGLASTDLLYYASGSMNVPGAMFTASHNPAQYNGIKMCTAGAKSIGIDNGLRELRELARGVLGQAVVGDPSLVTRRNLLADFAKHVLSFVDVSAMRSLKVVADTANGMGGLVVPAVFERLPMIDLEIMYGELDGTFPNHPADPIQPANQRDLQARVLAGGFDVGLAFDGDADRVFLVDEQGRTMSGSTTTAILAQVFLRRSPGATILYNLISSRAVAEVIAENGGTGQRTKNGHSYMKQVMAETGAVFAGEHSGHYYFADNYRADSGLIAALVVLGEMSRTGLPLSKLREPVERYANSGEINTQVKDIDAVIARVAEKYSRFPQDRLDGLTVDCGDWWFNVRASNTEPLLRLNLEAPTREQCDNEVATLLQLITA